MTRSLTLGSRPSKLARWQTQAVLELIKQDLPAITCSIEVLVTEGDKVLERPLPEIGGKGVFTTELESALLTGKIDLAVHSLKDLPIGDTPGLCTAAISQRADARDVLVSANGQTLAELPPGARLGTSSLRRTAQAKIIRQDLNIVPIRGNVDTRIRKALEGDYDAIILAAAGIERLGLSGHISEYLSFERMLPAPGQGALAVQCREDDLEIRQMLHSIHHADTARAVTAERAFLAALGGGCSAPVAAYASIINGSLNMEGLVASVDGQMALRVTGTGEDPIELGTRLAQQALAQGAGVLLA
jgi:hydroxymethylbilane synthase